MSLPTSRGIAVLPRPPARIERADLPPERVVVLPTTRVMATPKYSRRVRRYLRGLHPRGRVARSLRDAALEGLLEGARVDFVRVHSLARQADGSPLRRVTRRRVRRLLRRGRVLSRDAAALTQGLEALGAGAALVRLGTPTSLDQGGATEIA